VSDELVVKIKGDGDYPLDPEAALADLTGTETIMLEEFLGGWDKFDPRGATTRSLVAIIWLAKRQAGKDVSLDEVAEIKGLMFGDVFDLEEVSNGGPPAEAPDSAPSLSSSESSSDPSGVGESSSVTT